MSLLLFAGNLIVAALLGLGGLLTAPIGIGFVLLLFACLMLFQAGKSLMRILRDPSRFEDTELADLPEADRGRTLTPLLFVLILHGSRAIDRALFRRPA